ncbi:universal stress protein [Gilvimarinus sp. F26214L]|uniref:universal stress protein n=1 Tax=Gilvimarinus sp. DZF01 TaxID=3461371 RepID=UPI004045B404
MKRFTNILYVSEPSAPQEAAISRAVSLAQSNQADLTVIDVVPTAVPGFGMSPGRSVSDFQEALVAEGRQQLEALVAPHGDWRTDVMVGRKFQEVIRAVMRDGYDLVIKPSENPGYIERLFGSDDMHLLRKCPCPVWLIKPDSEPSYECVVAAVDFDPDEPDTGERSLNMEILELACSLALADFASLHLIHVWDAPQARVMRLWADNPDAAAASVTEGERSRQQGGMEHLTEKLRARIGAEAFDYLSPRVHLPMGEARRAIPQMVTDLKADLLVMGTVARVGVPGLIIGNTAEAVLDQLKCSVLAIKPPGYVSPVT